MTRDYQDFFVAKMERYRYPNKHYGTLDNMNWII
jgi:hypothetical protein